MPIPILRVYYIDPVTVDTRLTEVSFSDVSTCEWESSTDDRRQLWAYEYRGKYYIPNWANKKDAWADKWTY